MKRERANALMFQRTERGPVTIVRGEGVYLYDDRGYRYIDAAGGPMVVNIGHGRPEIAEAARQAMEQLTYVLPVFAHESRLELAERIQQLTPGSLNRIWFGSGGSESVEAALKFAYQYRTVTGRPGKYKMIGRRQSYHGNTFFTLAVGGMRSRQEAFAPLLPALPHAAECYCYRCPFGQSYPDCGIACADDLEAVIQREGADTVCAFIAEPVVAAAAGVAPPPTAEYFQRIRAICDRYDVLFIADEVVCGFGRTGRNFGMDHFDVVPDIMTFAKGVASGYAPLGGFAVRDEIMEPFESAGVEFNTIFTYSAHPLACAIGVAVQRILQDEDLIARAAEMGAYFGASLQRLADLPIVGDVRGLGMLWGIELVRDKATKAPFPAAKQVKMDVLVSLMRRGVMTYLGYGTNAAGNGDQLILAPPFIIEREQIDEVVGALEETLRECGRRHLN